MAGQLQIVGTKNKIIGRTPVNTIEDHLCSPQKALAGAKRFSPSVLTEWSTFHLVLYGPLSISEKSILPTPGPSLEDKCLSSANFWHPCNNHSVYSSITYIVPLCAIIPSLVFEIPVLKVYAEIKTMGPYLPRWSLLPVPADLPDQNLKSQDSCSWGAQTRNPKLSRGQFIAVPRKDAKALSREGDMKQKCKEHNLHLDERFIRASP